MPWPRGARNWSTSATFASSTGRGASTALHAPRGMLEFWVDPESPYHKPEFSTGRTLVLFCAAAARSALAAKTLQDMGVENVAEMEGRYTAWVEAGHPVQKG